jgi:Flp pilus assembly protein TadG
MRYHGRKHARNGERGVTMILVVIAMLSMLAMVALAIDVIALYAARSEAQRAADGAALAAAKMLVDAGVTADPTNAGLQTTAQTVARTMARDVARQASIAGRQIQAADVTVVYPNTGLPSFGINPTVTVTVQRTNLPTFFSRIWSRAALTVRTSATAEAFNPSNSSSLTGGAGVPVGARCVKPFLLPNCDPAAPGGGCGGTAATFFNVATGAITRPGQAPTGIIGESFTLSANCGAGPTCVLGPPNIGAPNIGQYYPAQMSTPPANACPAACGGGTDFEQNIECCNPTALTCGTTAGTATSKLLADTTVFPDGGGGPAQSGVKCLIHQNNGANGQDILNNDVSGALTYPLQIQVGNDHPLAGPLANSYVNTSDSLVTVPVYDDVAAAGPPTTAGGVQIIGFLQLFINRSFPGGGGPKAGSFQATVVNVAGCGSAASGTPVFNGSSAAVPVRLTHQ